MSWKMDYEQRRQVILYLFCHLQNEPDADNYMLSSKELIEEAQTIADEIEDSMEVWRLQEIRGVPS